MSLIRSLSSAVQLYSSLIPNDQRSSERRQLRFYIETGALAFMELRVYVSWLTQIVYEQALSHAKENESSISTYP